jgi:hypothetical protein
VLIGLRITATLPGIDLDSVLDLHEPAMSDAFRRYTGIDYDRFEPASHLVFSMGMARRSI